MQFSKINIILIVNLTPILVGRDKNLAQILRIEKGFQEINLETLTIVAPATIHNLNQIINDLEVFYNLSIYLSSNYDIKVFITSGDHFQKVKTNKSI